MHAHALTCTPTPRALAFTHSRTLARLHIRPHARRLAHAHAYTPSLPQTHTHPHARTRTPHSLMQEGQCREAVGEFREAVAADDRHACAYARTHTHSPSLSKAYPLLPTHTHSLMQEGQYSEALGEFRKAVAADDKHARAYMELGVLLHLSGDIPAALEMFEKATELDPALGEAYVKWGNVCAFVRVCMCGVGRVGFGEGACGCGRVG